MPGAGARPADEDRERKSDFVKKCATEAQKTHRDSFTPLRKVQANIAGADKKLVGTEAQVGSQEKVYKSIQQSFRKQSRFVTARNRTAEKSADSGPGEEGCSQKSRACEVCGAIGGEHQQPRSDGHPHTTAGQGGGGREMSSAAVSGSSHHCRHHMLPSLS